MDLPGHEGDLGRPGTPVGHVNGADAGGVLEHLDREMPATAGAGATHIQFARLRLAQRHQLGNAPNRHIVIEQEISRIIEQHAQRPEIPQGIERPLG